MAPITTTIDVGRTQLEVFDYVTDPTRFIEWQHGVVAGRMEADRRYGVGARCLTTRRIGFAERPVTSEITHIQRPRTWDIRGIDGPIRAIVHVTVDPLDDDHARVTIQLDFTGHGIGKLLVPLAVRPQASREMPENLQKLKQRLESRSSSAPPASSSQNSR
jgi:Polyketide cyclase / dehydrase and lipid transport